jgi:protein-S-isoprenylcysteine O-methyltransferase Ste14
VPQLVAGAVLLLLGLGVMLWGIRAQLFARTTIMPHRSARALVTTGPFRFTRNPTYLGLVAMYLGVAVVLNDAWPLVLLPFVLVTMTSWVIVREEAHLLDAFGDEYRAYCSRVRRWI